MTDDDYGQYLERVGKTRRRQIDPYTEEAKSGIRLNGRLHQQHWQGGTYCGLSKRQFNLLNTSNLDYYSKHGNALIWKNGHWPAKRIVDITCLRCKHVKNDMDLDLLQHVKTFKSRHLCLSCGTVYSDFTNTSHRYQCPCGSDSNEIITCRLSDTDPLKWETNVPMRLSKIQTYTLHPSPPPPDPPAGSLSESFTEHGRLAEATDFSGRLSETNDRSNKLIVKKGFMAQIKEFLK